MKKNIKNYNAVSAGAHKVGKLVFGPTLTLVFLIFKKCEIGTLHIFRKFSLSTFKEI